MRAFEVSINGKRACRAGVGDQGVLIAIVTWASKDLPTHGIDKAMTKPKRIVRRPTLRGACVMRLSMYIVHRH